MCSRVVASSAFSSSSDYDDISSSISTATADQQRSLHIRQKKVLTRDDSGVFSSPSPLTPSRSPLAAFPPLSPHLVSSAACNGSAPPPPPSPISDDGATMSSSENLYQQQSTTTEESPAPKDESLLRAFNCRHELGQENWASCSHTHCISIREQWIHLITCGQGCQECQSFQKRILVHAAHCHDSECTVTLCQEAKDKLLSEMTTPTSSSSSQARHHLPPQRSNSFQSSLGSPRPPQFLSLNEQRSLDDMSPMSPFDYPSFVRDQVTVGVGLLPRHLQGDYSLRASEIMREMESDGPLDKFVPPGEKSTPLPAPSLSSQGTKYTTVGTGVLSPIEEHPPCDDDRPSQTILHPLEPNVLTQGRDGRYLQRRDYDLNEHLGSGGFGTCTCARDHKTEKMFVIKSNKFSDEKMVDSLKSESDILSKIPHHSNITTFLGALIEEEGSQRNCRLMIELAEHGSLASMLMNEEGEPEPLPLDQSLFYMSQILRGVFHLHSNSILHLDIKAENVLVLEGGRRVKLTDFGTAAHIDDIVAGCIAKLKGVTPHFTAPEIIKGDVPSFSSDIWSCVCVLIQLLTAQLPGFFTGNNTRESMTYTLGKYQDGDIEKLIPLSQMEMPPEVQTIFSNTFRVDPRTRPSALQLLSYSALEEACEYEQYFDDVGCQAATEEEAEPQSLEGAELSTFSSSIPHLIVGSLPGNDSDVSLDIGTKPKRVSQDSGLSTRYDRTQTEVYPNDPVAPPPLSVEPLASNYSILTAGGLYRRHSLSGGRSLPSNGGGHETRGIKFSRCYGDTNDTTMYHSLPDKSSSGSFVSQKVRPNFVHLIHSNSAPMVMSDSGGQPAGSEDVCDLQQTNATGRLRRSSSEVYVDRGPEIDTPEEKKKKRELELAAAAIAAQTKDQPGGHDLEQDLVTMTTAAHTINNSSSSSSSSSSSQNEERWSPPTQRSHAFSASAGQSDRSHGGGYPRQQSHRKTSFVHSRPVVTQETLV